MQRRCLAAGLPAEETHGHGEARGSARGHGMARGYGCQPREADGLKLAKRPGQRQLQQVAGMMDWSQLRSKKHVRRVMVAGRFDAMVLTVDGLTRCGRGCSSLVRDNQPSWRSPGRGGGNLRFESRPGWLRPVDGGTLASD